ncbi:MAG: RND transporter, partial [bacterium]
MKKWIIWGSIIGVLLLLVIIGAVNARKTKPIAITVASVIKADFTREVSGTGNIEAKEYTLTFGRQDRVAKVAVVLGDHVVKGQLLAE